MRHSIRDGLRARRAAGEAAAPREMVEMLGVRRTGMRWAVAAAMAAYVVVGLMLPHLEVTDTQLAVSIVGSIGLAATLWLAVSGESDPLGVVPTVGAVVLGAVCGAAVWWSIPPGLMNWVRPGAPMVAYAIAMSLLVVRGRARWAWVGFGLVVVISVTAVLGWGWRPGTSVPVVLRMFLSLVPVTLMMLFVRPLLRVVRVFDQREVEAAAEAAAQAATVAQRRRHLAVLGQEVGPFLAQTAAGREITDDDAMRAHLLEASLRDEVRGAGWMSRAVRQSVAAARRRGVGVRLFDDRSSDGGCAAAEIEDSGRRELVRVLDAASGGLVTARLLPERRDVVAVISESAGVRVTRSVCRVDRDGTAAWERDADGAFSR